MRHIAGIALTGSSTFVAVMAIMVNSPALFYMGTGLVAMIGACRLQSWLAVRGLKFERIAPATAHVGELITVQVVVWSEKKLRRPLVTIRDHLPSKLRATDRSPSLPIAPAYDQPIKTQYRFRPRKRGLYLWSGLTVTGTDSLGLTLRAKEYETETTELLVLPSPIPVSIDLPMGGGWGVSEADSGHTRGAGIEPRGVRPFVYGDSLRHVHWRSTARTGQILVKEFEAGTHNTAVFLIQDLQGSEVGENQDTTLELMCGHAVYLAQNFLRQGSRVEFPEFDDNPSHGSQHERLEEIYSGVARIEADKPAGIASQLRSFAASAQGGSVVFAMMAVQESDMDSAVAQVAARGGTVVPLLYDSSHFDKGKKIRSAADPGYVEMLRHAGARPAIMPVGGQIGPT